MSESVYQPATPQMSARRKALAPSIHDAFDGFFRAVFAEGALPEKTKQLIAVAVAHMTQYPYCITGHTTLARRKGASPEEVMETAPGRRGDAGRRRVCARRVGRSRDGSNRRPHSHPSCRWRAVVNLNSFGTRDRFVVDGEGYEIFRLDRMQTAHRLPYSLKVLLENSAAQRGRPSGHRRPGVRVGRVGPGRADRHRDPVHPRQGVEPPLHRRPVRGRPGRDARGRTTALGGDPAKINPLIPTESVIDHSVIADVFDRPDASRVNAGLEFSRNRERYQLLRWAQQAFDDFLVVPPDTGICHQVNLEYLARVVFTSAGPDGPQAYPDTLVGTDSHTPMVNGLGVLGWGVGGIEAEAAMLGQPMSMLIPQVLGLKLTGELRERHDRDRSGAHGRRTAAPYGGGGEVR